MYFFSLVAWWRQQEQALAHHELWVLANLLYYHHRVLMETRIKVRGYVHCVRLLIGWCLGSFHL
jgi:hypothetical protein